MFCKGDYCLIVLSWFILSIYFGIEYLVYKKFGRNATINTLIICGYGWTYGLTVATGYIISAFIALLFLNIFYQMQITLNVGLLLELLINYLISVCVINIWAKNYLKKRGIKPNPYYGFRGFFKICKEKFEITKEKQKKDSII
jgi:hypothetical protein